jgi:transposase
MAGDRKNPTRAASSDSRYSFMEFVQRFPDDESCLVYLWTTRYAPDGEHALCPKCEDVTTFKRYETTQQRQSWTCTTCGQHIHPTAGTIFHKSSTALHLWFYALYIMASTRCGVAAKQLERELGVTYKTAWRMFHLIRNQLMVQDDDTPLDGDVEMDETYVGGKPRKREIAAMRRTGLGPMQAGQAAARKKKSTVYGAVERGGRVRAELVPANTGGIAPRVHQFVLPAASIFTDEWVGYNKPGKKFNSHQRVNHSQAIYVDGNVHTNTIEGFWSLVKRGIGGTHHAVSAKHLQGYLNEYVWRYNRRDETRSMFEELLLRAALTTP